MDSAEPLDGWPIEEPIRMAKPAENDVYGGLHKHLRGIFQRFCSRLRAFNLYFHISQLDAVKLSSVLGLATTTQTSFDRIEVRAAKGFYLFWVK